MTPDQYEDLREPWLDLMLLLASGRNLSPLSLDTQFQLRLALEGHRFNPTWLEPPWYTGAVRDVSITDNEGSYTRHPAGHWLKSLDLGHRAWDAIEDTTNSSQQLSYKGKWEHVRILPVHDERQVPFAGAALVGANGEVLARGTYMFVICEDGIIRYFPNDDSHCERGADSKHYVQYLPHAALAYHAPVLAAGNLGVLDGGILSWAASNSGHYRVDDRMCRHNLLVALAVHGYRYQATSDPESAGIEMGAQGQRGNAPANHYFCFYNFPKWRLFQAERRTGMNALMGSSRPPSNEVTKLISAAVEQLHAWKAAPAQSGTPMHNQQVFDSIGNSQL